MKKQSISPAGFPESDAEWRTWEEAQRALNRHIGEDAEGHSEYDPSVWMMGRHAPEHEKYQDRQFAEPENDGEGRGEWDGPVMCHDCACYHANGEGDPDHAEKYEAGMERIYPDDVALACPEDRECHERGTCAICGDQINEYGLYGPEGHRMAIFNRSGLARHRVARAISRASDTIWR